MRTILDATNLNIDKVRQYWVESSAKDFAVAEDLFRLGHFSHCLFFCHLCLEKRLKAVVVEITGKHAPPIHDLKKLAELARLELDEEKTRHLEVIATFNIRARYDSVKHDFYQIATEAYTQKWFGVSRELYQWLRDRA